MAKMAINGLSPERNLEKAERVLDNASVRLTELIADLAPHAGSQEGDGVPGYKLDLVLVELSQALDSVHVADEYARMAREAK